MIFFNCKEKKRVCYFFYQSSGFFTVLISYNLYDKKHWNHR